MTGWQEEAERNEAVFLALKVEKEIILEQEKANNPWITQKDPHSMNLF